MFPYRRGQVAALALLLGACSSVPLEPNLYYQAKADYLRASTDPQVAQLAPQELTQAKLAMRQAKYAWDTHAEDEEILRLSHIAKQKVAIAEEKVKLRQAENRYASLSQQRDQLLAVQRDREAQRAQQLAQAAQAHNQQLEQELRELNAKPTARGEVLALDNLVFSTGSAKVSEGGEHKLQQLANILVQNPDQDVMIEGFTDSVGSEAFNRALSEKRAEAIRDELVSMGVASSRIDVRGYGEDFPVADNKTAVGRQMNRRVEIIIADDTHAIAPRVAAAGQQGQ